MNGELLAALRDEYCRQYFPAATPLVDHLRGRFGKALLAVVLYGSRLDPALATDTSFFDFYLICDDYRAFYVRRRDRWLAQMLPPNIYYLELPRPDGGKQTCKYCVVSLADLQAATSPAAKDFYHLGRFSKRLALLWWRDDLAREAVLGVCLQAMRTLVPFARAQAGPNASLPAVVRCALALSYQGEVRLEKTAEKVDALYRSAEAFYLRVWERLLTESTATADPAPLLARSRRRAKARWPKNVLLVDNWVDILLDKIERTYGTKLELTPRERRWILILGWKHFFRLRREGKIK